jgi:class 3 adenylate cyclase/CHASE2 domain-containing sensor protein
VIGLSLTLFVVVLDGVGGLGGLERSLYDARALHFQHFTPPPSDRLVHLDIDDAALEAVGRWPWPRATLAEVVDEVRLAGADVLALDIIFPDPQEPTTVMVDGRPVTTDHDAVLAEAFRRFGRVLVPVAFDNLAPTRSDSPLKSAAEQILSADLAATPRDVAAHLPKQLGPLSDDTFFAARRAALARRITDELSQGDASVDEVRRRVLPRVGRADETSSLARLFEIEFRQVQSVRETRRFAVPLPANCPPLLLGSAPKLLPQFARVTRFTGYINDFPSEDGVVRNVPLWVDCDGVLYPQFDLALACAVSGVDVRAARLTADRLSIPVTGDREIAIPVRVINARDMGGARGKAGAFFDIPWFGWRAYETMYDYPAHRAIKQHVPIATVWGLAESRRAVARGIADCGNAVNLFAKDLSLPAAEAFLKRPSDAGDLAAWVAGASAILLDASQRIGPLGEMSANDTTGTSERDAVVAFHAIRETAENCRQVLAKAAELKSALGGKVVLVGSTATGALDARPTSLHGQCPGVVIHGATLNALLALQSWRYLPWSVTAAITVALGLLTTASVTWLSPWKALGGTLVLLLSYGAANCILLFDYGDRIVGLAGPVVVISAAWGSLTLFRFVAERSQHAHITRKFRGYVDPQLVEYVVQHPEVSRFEGQVREMTVCFSDLVGFTTMTEQLREAAVPILGRYINRMVTTMRKHRGFLNRLMGDGIMFSYGAPLENPNHAVDAVATAMEMHEQLAELNRELAAEGHPQLALRVGVSTGKVVVGDSGGTQAVDYTCIGDTTNLGARLESANKFTGTKNLISGRTAELLEGKYLLRPVALLQVAGKTLSVMTYEPLARAEDATDRQRNLVAMTQEMVEHYRSGRFEHCIAATDALDETFGPSKLTKLYRDTCDRYIIERAPDGFAGQIVLSEK